MLKNLFNFSLILGIYAFSFLPAIIGSTYLTYVSNERGHTNLSFDVCYAKIGVIFTELLYDCSLVISVHPIELTILQILAILSFCSFTQLIRLSNQPK